MRQIIVATIAAGAAACAAFAAPHLNSGNLSDREQKRLAQVLDGRTPGEPLFCVNSRDVRGNEGFGSDIILFRGQGRSGDVYVNRPPGGCGNFTSSTALVIRTTATRLCKGDIVELYEPTVGIARGSCSLGEFVPYRRAD